MKAEEDDDPQVYVGSVAVVGGRLLLRPGLPRLPRRPPPGGGRVQGQGHQGDDVHERE